MEARYCPYCGANMATEEDLLLDDLGTLWVWISQSMGSNTVEDSRKIINKIEKYIKNKNPRLTRFNQ